MMLSLLFISCISLTAAWEEAPAPGDQCVFPFVFNGKTYSECTSVQTGFGWCSKDENYDGNWQKCVSAHPYGKTWKQVGGSKKVISSGRAGVWGVNKHNDVYGRKWTHADPKRVGYHLGDSWFKLPGLKLKEISSGYNVVWGIDEHDNIYIRKVLLSCGVGYTGKRGGFGVKIQESQKIMGVKWVKIPGSLKQISVSATNNDVWGVNKHHQIYHRVGITKAKPEGTDWRRIDGALKYISVGEAGVWGVNTHDYIYYRWESRGGRVGTKWVRVPGALKQISSGASAVWGINKHDHIYARSVSDCEPKGVEWKKIPGVLKSVSIGSHDDSVWGVNAHDNIYSRRH